MKVVPGTSGKNGLLIVEVKLLGSMAGAYGASPIVVHSVARRSRWSLHSLSASAVSLVACVLQPLKPLGSARLAQRASAIALSLFADALQDASSCLEIVEHALADLARTGSANVQSKKVDARAATARVMERLANIGISLLTRCVRMLSTYLPRDMHWARQACPPGITMLVRAS